MKLGVVALDYDGTIASGGRLDPQVRAAIAEARARGIAVVLVTGRILADLVRLLEDPREFDAIVAENGALLHFPAAARSTAFGHAPPAQFAAELARRGVAALSGERVVETDATSAQEVLATIRELELPLAILFNRGRLMVLPQSISKGTGLLEALRAMRLSAHNAVGIGDAENDHELLRTCELGVAVAWGSAALEANADEVIEGSGPADVARYLRGLLQSLRLPPERIGARRLHLGIARGGASLDLAMRGRNVLIAGDPRSGKSWVAGLLCEQMLLQRYCVCVIDPEGEYATLEALPGVVHLEVREQPPDWREVERLLHHPDVSLVIGLAQVPLAEKRRYVPQLLRHLAAFRRVSGIPHRILVDEAHYFLHDPDVTELLDLDLAGYTLVTYHVSALHAAVLAAAEAVIVTCETDPEEARALHELKDGGLQLEEWRETLAGLQLDEAVLLPGTEESGSGLVRFRIARRLTSHVRHRRKYLSEPVGEARAFIFTREGKPTGAQAASLEQLMAEIAAAEDDVLEGHLRRGDLSRWFAEVVTDRDLAREVAALERSWRGGGTGEARKALIDVLRRRYA